MSRPPRQAAQRHGQWAEWLGLLWLGLHGYHPVARQRRGRRGSGAGEIDLLVRRGRLLCLVEIKLRSSLAEAAAAITPAQRQRLVRAAEVWLARHPERTDCAFRFDALLLAPWRRPCHLKDAWRDRG